MMHVFPEISKGKKDYLNKFRELDSRAAANLNTDNGLESFDEVRKYVSGKKEKKSNIKILRIFPAGTFGTR